MAMNNINKYQDNILSQQKFSMSHLENNKNEDMLEQITGHSKYDYKPEPTPNRTYYNFQKEENNFRRPEVIINEESIEDINKDMNDKKLLYALKVMDLEKLFKSFNMQFITFNDLFLLSREDLIEMKIPIGPRNRILYFSEEYKKNASNYDMPEIIDFFNTHKNLIINKVDETQYLGGENKNQWTLQNNINKRNNNNYQPYSVTLPQPNEMQLNEIQSQDYQMTNKGNLDESLKDDFGEELMNEPKIQQVNKKMLFYPQSNNLNNNSAIRSTNKSENITQSRRMNSGGLLSDDLIINGMSHCSYNSLEKCTTNFTNSIFDLSRNNEINQSGISQQCDKKKNSRSSRTKENKKDSKNKIPKGNTPCLTNKNSTSNLTGNLSNFKENKNKSSNMIPKGPKTNKKTVNIQNNNVNNYTGSNIQIEHNLTNNSVNSNIKSDNKSINNKIVNSPPMFQNFENLFSEVESFQQQYENMKIKNDERNSRLNSLLGTKKSTKGNEEISNENDSNRNFYDGISGIYETDAKNISTFTNMQKDNENTASNTNILKEFMNMK
ncbi:MAG: hypothetical protein MJ252_06020 [archaeon]|nr:hypothetical protein [archaeon]